MFFAGNLQQGREGLLVTVDQGADLLRDVLIDQQDRNVFALGCEVVEMRLDIRRGCLLRRIGRSQTRHSSDNRCNSRLATYLGVHDCKILGIPIALYLSDSGQQEACCGILRQWSINGRSQLVTVGGSVEAIEHRQEIVQLTSSHIDAISVRLAACCEMDIVSRAPALVWYEEEYRRCRRGMHEVAISSWAERISITVRRLDDQLGLTVCMDDRNGITQRAASQHRPPSFDLGMLHCRRDCGDAIDPCSNTAFVAIKSIQLIAPQRRDR